MITINKLESIEIRPADKVFNVNGEDFGHCCSTLEITISFNGLGKWIVRLETEQKVVYQEFDRKTRERIGEPKTILKEEPSSQM